jgi:hypothetical protein
MMSLAAQTTLIFAYDGGLRHVYATLAQQKTGLTNPTSGGGLVNYQSGLDLIGASPPIPFQILLFLE